MVILETYLLPAYAEGGMLYLLALPLLVAAVAVFVAIFIVWEAARIVLLGVIWLADRR